MCIRAVPQVPSEMVPNQQFLQVALWNLRPREGTKVVGWEMHLDARNWKCENGVVEAEVFVHLLVGEKGEAYLQTENYI